MYLTKIVRLTFYMVSLRYKSGQATLSLKEGSPTREPGEDFQLLHLKLPRTDVLDRQPPRSEQNDHMELLSAASDAELMCDSWLSDQRINTERLKS